MADTPEDQTVIVVGAGFSAALTGGNNPMIGNGPLPTLQRLGKELSQFAHDSNKRWDAEGQFSDKTICHGLTLLKQTFEADSNPDTNFEQFISMLASQKSFLEQFPSANRPDLPQNDPYVLDFIIFLLCQLFEDRLGKGSTTLFNKFNSLYFEYHVRCTVRKDAFVAGFFDLMDYNNREQESNKISFISLNYDGLLEAFIGNTAEFHAMGTYNPNGSHGIPFRHPLDGFFRNDQNFDPPQKRYLTKILKPHGSIHFYKLKNSSYRLTGGALFSSFIPIFMRSGWYVASPIMGNQFINLADYFEPTPFIIPPTFNKDIHLGSDYFNEALIQSHRAITKARNIVVIGFSLPPSDLHLWAALQSIDWTDKQVFICDIEKEDGDAFKNWSRVARGAKVELLPFEGLPCDTEPNIKNFFDDLKKRIH